MRTTSGTLVGGRTAVGGPKMLSRWFRNPLVWSPVVAVVTQLLLAAVAAAASGGGDFPVR